MERQRASGGQERKAEMEEDRQEEEPDPAWLSIATGGYDDIRLE